MVVQKEKRKRYLTTYLSTSCDRPQSTFEATRELSTPPLFEAIDELSTPPATMGPSQPASKLLLWINWRISMADATGSADVTTVEYNSVLQLRSKQNQAKSEGIVFCRDISFYAIM